MRSSSEMPTEFCSGPSDVPGEQNGYAPYTRDSSLRVAPTPSAYVMMSLRVHETCVARNQCEGNARVLRGLYRLVWVLETNGSTEVVRHVRWWRGEKVLTMPSSRRVAGTSDLYVNPDHAQETPMLVLASSLLVPPRPPCRPMPPTRLPASSCPRLHGCRAPSSPPPCTASHSPSQACASAPSGSAYAVAVQLSGKISSSFATSLPSSPALQSTMSPMHK